MILYALDNPDDPNAPFLSYIALSDNAEENPGTFTVEIPGVADVSERIALDQDENPVILLLKHGEVATIKNLFAGTYKIVELNSSGYTPTYGIDSGSWKTALSSSDLPGGVETEKFPLFGDTAVAFVNTVPTPNIPDESTETTETTEPTTETTTETTEPTTETTEDTTEPTIDTTEPTTESTTEPSTEPTIDSTEPGTEPTTESSTEPTTEPTPDKPYEPDVPEVPKQSTNDTTEPTEPKNPQTGDDRVITLWFTFSVVILMFACGIVVFKNKNKDKKKLID